MQSLKWVFLLLIGFSINMVSAQKEIKEGTLTYEITEISSDNPQLAQQLAMMKGSSMTVLFADGKQLTKMNMMNGMMQQKIVMNPEEKTGEMYMDMMGQKIMVKMPMGGEEDESGASTDIEYFPNETKKIAGYDAYKAVITTKAEGQEMELITYITEDLAFDGEVIRNAPGADKLKGLPLEYTVSQPQMSMTFTAQNISMEVDKSEFDFDKAGYREMSQEELQQMGGMGF
jgi:hypothetical protein